MKTKLLPIFFLIGLAFASHKAMAGEILLLSEKDGSVTAGQAMDTLEDPRGELTLKDVLSPEFKRKFRPTKGAIPNYGFTDSVYWARYTAKNTSAKTHEYILEVGFPLIDDLQIYVQTPDKTIGKWPRYRLGREHLFNKRSVYHRNFIFPVTIPRGKSRTIYMRIRTADGMIFPAAFWKRKPFARYIQHEQFFFGIYYGIIIVMILYNLFIFISVRDRNYLYYVLYISAFGLFQMAMNGLAYQYLWPNLSWWAIHANPVLIGLSVLFATNFSMNFLETKKYTPRIHRGFQVLMGLSALLTIASFLVKYRITITLGQLLPLSAVFMAIPAAIYCYRGGNRAARYYLVAWSFFLIGIILSTLRVLGLIPHHFITEYGLQIGSGLEMVLLAFALADRINIINQEKKEAQEKEIEAQQLMVDNLQRSQSQIEAANTKISLSEEKYRLLVEGSSDIIFSLDENFNFITANNAMKHELKILPEELQNMNLLDIIHEDEEDNNLARQLAERKLKDFASSREPLNFKSSFYSTRSIEPKEMQVHLEYLNIKGKNEILGKASNVVEDVLLRYFQEERQKYVISNYLTSAEEITHRLTRNLQKFLEIKEVTFLRIALREIVINAIEHGNLGITFEEKSDAIESDQYFSFINERQLDPEKKNKKVNIEYSLDERRVAYIITDEGMGFDHKQVIQNSADKANEAMLSHGRGIAMAANVFDRVIYNDNGNQVMLIKYFDTADVPVSEEKLTV